MRLSVVVLLCAVAGVLGGGALVGLWCLGVCLIFVSVAAGWWALFRDDGRPVPQRAAVTELREFLERKAAESW